MEIKRKQLCPLLKKECLYNKCPWFIKVNGYDINTGKYIDEWDCVVSALPKLVVNSAGMQRQTTAAVDSFRAEINTFNQRMDTAVNDLRNKHE